MTSKVKIILFVFIGLGILGMIAYGYFSSIKLENHKELSVNTNIDGFIYDEAKDTIDVEEEDLDGDEAEMEEDDYEVYEEDGGWDDDGAAEPMLVKRNLEEDDDDELEELYDNKKPPMVKTMEKTEPEPKIQPKLEKKLPTKSKPVVDTPENSNSGIENYVVIVGSFKSKTNAGKKLKQLEKIGIEGEIIKLKGSDLETVVAGRFSQERLAESFAKELKIEHELSTFVKELN